MDGDEKVCPRCAETIKAAAGACRFCNYEFGTPAKAPTAPILASPSMRTCDNCGKVYAAKFVSCPHCKNKKIGKGCLAVVALLIGIGVIASIFSSDNKSDPTNSGSEKNSATGTRESLAQCINRLASSGSYSSLDGGKSAMQIMAGCEDQVKLEQPACFQDDPHDNSTDNEKQLSPGAACRLAVVATIQIALKAHEAGIPLSAESQSAPANTGQPAQIGPPPADTTQPTPAQENPSTAGEASAPNQSAAPDSSLSEAEPAASASASGPSFDCVAVSSSVLKLICATPALAAADRELATTYQAARARSGSPEALVIDERHWIQRRTNSTADVPSLLQMYRDRIDYLSKLQ